MAQPVPTNSWLSNLVRVLHVSTTSVPPEPGSIDEGSAKSASSSPSVTANNTDLVLPEKEPSPSTQSII